MQCRGLFGVPLLLSLVGFSSAMAGNPPAVDRPVMSRAVVPGHLLSPRALRLAVARRVVDKPTIGRLIRRRPVLGGAWSVGSAEDVRFAAPGVVAIDYEDGHIAGRLVVRVVDASDPRSWVVLEDRPL
jgi:hypothetical protein